MTATLASVIPAMENMIGNTIRVYMSGQKRRFDGSAALQLAFDLGFEPVIGL